MPFSNFKTLLFFAVVSCFCSSSQTNAYTLSNTPLVKGWSNGKVKINYSVSNCPISDTAMLSIITNAIAIWNKVPTSSLVVFTGDKINVSIDQLLDPNYTEAVPSPLIICDTKLSTHIRTNSQYIPAATSTTYSNSTYSEAIMLLNAEPGKDANIGNISQDKLTIIIAHELGHVFGLGHSSSTKALMYYSGTYKTALSLSQDDIDGISYLYPRSEFNPKYFMGCDPSAQAAHDLKSDSNFELALQYFLLLLLVLIIYQGIKLSFKRRSV